MNIYTHLILKKTQQNTDIHLIRMILQHVETMELLQKSLNKFAEYWRENGKKKIQKVDTSDWVLQFYNIYDEFYWEDKVN